MALVVKDRVKETTSTTGTGTLTLAGAVAKFQSFSVVGDGNTTYYAIESGNGTDWEVGVGTYTASGTTLSRDTILESSNAGSAINLSGTSTVFCTYPAERSVSTADIGTTIQAYDADTAKYDDTTANFTGNLQKSGANVLTANQTITLSGDATGSGTTAITVTVADNSHSHTSANISDATSANTANTIVERDASGNFSAGTITAALTGNASTATTLQTARTINGVSFNGSANIVAEPYVEDDEATAATRLLTFVDNSTAGYKRLNEDSSLTYNPSTNTLTAGTFSGALTGNAATATKWATGRTISLTGDVTGTSASFDGSGNASITATVADDSHNHIISNVDGLQTALDSKASTGKAIAMAIVFGG